MITTLQAQVAALEAKLQYIQVVEGDLQGLSGPHVLFVGANVHIQNGTGATGNQSTPTGNLVIGYNEQPAGFQAGERSGAHNLIVGPEHRYTNVGGLIAGQRNSVLGPHSSVSAGLENTASGDRASVSGGHGNLANGLFAASVSGGYVNTASGDRASVSGGRTNSASGFMTSVSGGESNDASGNHASISGGFGHTAPGTNNWAAGSLFELQ